MKVFNYVLGRDVRNINIYPVGDLHIGDPLCNEREIRNLFNTILEDKNGYVILNGDLMNNATKNSPSDSYEEMLSPDEQMDYACALLNNFRHRILFCTTGNHEKRTKKDCGVDTTRRVMRELGIGDRYAEEGGVIFVRFGHETQHGRKVRYSIYATHGSGGGGSEGGKVNRLIKLSSIVDTDIYIHSHTHLPAVIKNDFIRVDNCNSTIAQVTKLFVNTSAKLNYGGYGQTLGLKPASIDSPIIMLDGTKKEMKSIL